MEPFSAQAEKLNTNANCSCSPLFSVWNLSAICLASVSFCFFHYNCFYGFPGFESHNHLWPIQSKHSKRFFFKRLMTRFIFMDSAQNNGKQSNKIQADVFTVIVKVL